MKASELIKQLEHRMGLYGDRDVVFAKYEDFGGDLVKFENVNGYMSHENTPNGTPVLVIWDE
ncbi:hypothetical protein D3C81_358540 [compost metagenome]